jgi:acetaldehyde dehydrogenase (acetylating)
MTNNLLELADLAAGLLLRQRHRNLPEVTAIDLKDDIQYGLAAAMQLYHPTTAQTVRAVARWAQELDTDITLVDRSHYVEINAVATVGSHTVRVWDHLTPDQARHLLTATGADYDENGRAAIAPALVLSVEWA